MSAQEREAARLYTAWRAAEAAEVGEEQAWDALIEYVEDHDLNHSIYDPRGYEPGLPSVLSDGLVYMADETLRAAGDIPPGAARDAALRRADLFRNAAAWIDHESGADR